jgi:collagenase-like PrtC family protease
MPDNTLELLAPAGDWSAMEAALDAGADAIYFGLTSLNARRRAKNFRQEEFAPAVEAIHARGARAYLTLNIDLTERELGQAARILELARQSRVDAVLVRDPALLALRPEYPELEFHFSTQTCVTNSADVQAAGKLGAARCVLAREMTLGEIAKASAVPGIQTEVFVQGALCFSVSGRCLLSSWAGGRSGNRGSCTSTCRVPWSVADEPAGTPLSMHDLATIHRLGALRRAGVKGLKIEGRLKNPAWVGRAVSLYRQALARLADGGAAGPSDEEFLRQVAELGDYTGRAMTCGYLDGDRDGLTGVAGREASDDALPASEAGTQGATGVSSVPDVGQVDEGPNKGQIVNLPYGTGKMPVAPDAAEADDDGSTFDFSLMIEPQGIVCSFRCGGRTIEWTVPKTVVRRAHKAVPVGQVLDMLAAGPIQNCALRQAETNDPEFLMVPRAVNALMDRVSNAVRQSHKAPGDTIKASLPPSVHAILERTDRHEMNRRKLGDEPDRARLRAPDVGEFTRQVQPEAVIVEGVTAGSLDRVLTAARSVPVVVALPSVFFEDEIPRLVKLLELCKAAKTTVEVNSWGGWRLAQHAGVRMEGGPGLGVLNSLAAQTLRNLGLRLVTLSVEADRRQFEELTAHCPAPCSMVIYGRPPLMTSRVRVPEESLGQPLEDRRGVRMIAQREQGLVVFRPTRPFDLREVQNERIHVQHLVVDLVDAEDPIVEWYDRPEEAFKFNYDRTLS